MADTLEQYYKQIEAVETALRSSTDHSEKESLESLKSNLEELVKLTEETIAASSHVGTSGNNHGTELSKARTFEEEMSMFQEEIRNLESHKSVDKLETIKEELESIVGQKCSAPHKHSWGTTTYHNAIVCSVLSVDETELENIRLRVLFTNPTHKEMVPCIYFLEGECKFEDDKCHYSHGEIVSFNDLKEYSEPKFESLARNCVVLAKMNDRIWHKGRVLCANFVERNCRVRLDNQRKEMGFNFEDLFPIFHDEDLSSGSSDDSESEGDSSDAEVARKIRLVEQSLFSYASNQPLGEWEKHTRGIGSKLMAKMGYITGTGLGWNGEGIITPVAAQILPPGRSLDHCMQLREASNGDRDLFNVEKKLKQQQKRQETINARAYAKKANETDVFSFLNETVFSKDSTDGNQKIKPSMKPTLQDHSTKTLNVESVRIADNIRRKKREIQKVKESIQRQITGSDAEKRLKSQLDAKEKELHTLRESESHLAREQMSRKTKDKLTVF